MWAPWMLKFNLHRGDILADNISLFEIIALWDAVKEGA
jgi:hypothetical protein